MSTTKFGAPNLDTPSSRYDFPKFALNSGKRIKEKPKLQLLTRGARWSTDPTRQSARDRGRG
jgi:hypothetical protein